MNFRTEIEIPPFKHLISYSDNIFTLGSCFADNIANYLVDRKYNVLANPFGVLYNPVSIYNSLKLIIDGREFHKTDLVENQSEWHSFYHHSDFSHHDQVQCLNNINECDKKASMFLKETNWMIITYGTSYVYRLKENGEVVSNCHKFSQSIFEKQKLSSEELKETIEFTLKILEDVNPNIKIIFTISPIRHWKDSAIANQLSKAQLIVAVNEIVDKNNNCFYFPSYEIMMDDLRDYRFYDEDLLHPNKVAINYIWQKFTESILNPDDKQIMKKIERIISAKNHRVRNPHSDEHKQFVKSQLNLIDQLLTESKNIDLAQEQKYFESFLD